jgi:hypothetical protein
MRLTLRDMELLQALHTARYLTTPQIEKLFWRGNTMGRTKACQQRLRLLHEYGLVRRIALPIRRGDKPKPYVYALDRKGAELLVTELGIEPAEIDWKTKSQQVLVYSHSRGNRVCAGFDGADLVRGRQRNAQSAPGIGDAHGSSRLKSTHERRTRSHARSRAAQQRKKCGYDEFDSDGPARISPMGMLALRGSRPG